MEILAATISRGSTYEPCTTRTSIWWKSKEGMEGLTEEQTSLHNEANEDGDDDDDDDTIP